MSAPNFKLSAKESLLFLTMDMVAYINLVKIKTCIIQFHRVYTFLFNHDDHEYYYDGINLAGYSQVIITIWLTVFTPSAA